MPEGASQSHTHTLPTQDNNGKPEAEDQSKDSFTSSTSSSFLPSQTRCTSKQEQLAKAERENTSLQSRSLARSFLPHFAAAAATAAEAEASLTSQPNQCGTLLAGEKSVELASTLSAFLQLGLGPRVELSRWKRRRRRQTTADRPRRVL